MFFANPIFADFCPSVCFKAKIELKDSSFIGYFFCQIECLTKEQISFYEVNPLKYLDTLRISIAKKSIKIHEYMIPYKGKDGFESVYRSEKFVETSPDSIVNIALIDYYQVKPGNGISSTNLQLSDTTWIKGNPINEFYYEEFPGTGTKLLMFEDHPQAFDIIKQYEGKKSPDIYSKFRDFKILAIYVCGE